MRILIAVEGTRGDVYPMLALARHALAHGHEVRLVAPPDFGDDVRACGAEFVSMGVSVREFIIGHAAALHSRGPQMFAEMKKWEKHAPPTMVESQRVSTTTLYSAWLKEGTEATKSQSPEGRSAATEEAGAAPLTLGLVDRVEHALLHALQVAARAERAIGQPVLADAEFGTPVRQSDAGFGMRFQGFVSKEYQVRRFDVDLHACPSCAIVKRQ